LRLGHHWLLRDRNRKKCALAAAVGVVLFGEGIVVESDDGGGVGDRDRGSADGYDGGEGCAAVCWVGDFDSKRDGSVAF